MKRTLESCIFLLAFFARGLESSSSFRSSDQKWTKAAKRLIAKGGSDKPGKGGNAGFSGEFVSSANPDLKVLAFDENYDFNLPPPPEDEGQPVDVAVSLNLRNILEVSRMNYLFGPPWPT